MKVDNINTTESLLRSLKLSPREKFINNFKHNGDVLFDSFDICMISHIKSQKSCEGYCYICKGKLGYHETHPPAQDQIFWQRFE